MGQHKGTSPALAGRKPSVGAGVLVYAVGDIHGRLDLLSRIVDKIERHADLLGVEEPTIVFLGDYIDRGPQSKEVVDFILKEMPRGFDIVCLRGNHEQMMLDFLDDAERGYGWCMNGGTETLRSYGVLRPNQTESADRFEKLRSGLLDNLPFPHEDFFERLHYYGVMGDYCFVHAGIRPGVPMEDQRLIDLLWIRDEFLNCDQDLGKIVVHGHTPDKEIQLRKNRIGIDTGAFATGILTCAVFFEDRIDFLQTEP